MKKRVLSLLLCLVMALSLIPTVAFAGSGSTAITKVEVTGVQTPVVGKSTDISGITITSTPANAFTVSSIYWFNNDANTKNDATFAANDRYFLSITLEPKAGYYFAYDSSDNYVGEATLNGQKAPLVYDYRDTGNLFIRSEMYDAAVATPITKVEVTGMQTPIVGQRCDTDNVTITTTPANAYTVEHIGWYDCTGSYPLAADTFEAGHEYLLDVRLSPKDGYYFEYAGSNEDYTGVATFNGKTAGGAESYQWGSSEIWLRSTDMTAATPITKVEVTGIQTPIVGQSTDTSGITITSTPANAFTVDDIFWFNPTDWTSEDTTFKEGKKYSLHISLLPKEGYCFPFSSAHYTGAATYNGQNVSTAYHPYSPLDTGELMLANGDRLATVATPINTVNITGVKMPVVGAKAGDCLNLTPADSTYVISEKFWNCVTDAEVLDANDMFEAGKEYYLGVTVAPADGYVMSEDAKILFNGGAIATDNDYTRVNKDGTLAGFTTDFAVTKGLAAPTVTLSNDAATGKVVVNWKAVSGAAKYEVYRATSKTGTYSKILTTTSLTCLNKLNATPGTIYYYKVRAIDANGKASKYSEPQYRCVDCAQPVITVTPNNTAKTITIKWNAVEGATKYEVYRATSKTGTYSKILTTTALSCTNKTNVVPGTTYYYKVIARGAAANADSAYSAVVSGKIGQLAAPTVTLTNDAATGKIAVNWKAVSGAAKYEVYRATSKTGTYSKILTTTELTCLNKLNATPGTVYYYKVRALDANGVAGEYSEPQYRCVDCAQPVITVTPNNAAGTITVKWNAVEGATKYEVYRATSKTGTYSKILTTTALTCTNKTNVVPGTTYYYKVIARGAAANADSAYSAVVSGKVGQLAAPTVTLSNDAATGKIVVNWKAVPGAAKYEVYRATSKTGTYSKILTTTSLTCLNKLNATPGKIYYYKVRALDASGTAGEYSAPQYRCVDCPQPVATVSLNSSGKPVVKWNAVEGATKYEVYRAASSNGTYSKIFSSETALSCTNTNNVVSGTTYYYKVLARGAATNSDSAYSAVVSIKAK